MRFFLVFFSFFIHAILFCQLDEREESLIVKAVRAKNLNEVKKLVESGVPLDETDRFSFNPSAIDVAVENNYQEIAKYLLEKGAKSRRYFSEAVKTGDVAWVKTLLGYHYYDSEALIYAVQSKNIAMVKFLLDENFPYDFSQKRRLGLFRKEYVSPMDEAISLGLDDIIFELVKAGVSVEEAFPFAALGPDNSLAINLIDLGLKTNELWLMSFSANNLILAKYCKQKGADHLFKDKAGLNAFHYSVKNNFPEGIKYCVDELKMSPTERTSENETALMLATENDNINLVKEFLNNPEFKIEDENVLGETVLFYAERSKNKAVMELILQAGANINHQDFGGKTLLMQAMQNGHLENYFRLKKLNPNLQLKDSKGQNILSYVVSGFYGSVDEVFSLINAGVDPKVVGTNGINLAFYAINHCNLELLTLLKNKGVSMDAKDADDHRPNCNDDEVIKFAILNGCNPNRGDNWNDSYLVKAIEDDKMDLAVFLIHNGADVNWKKHGDEPLIMYVVKQEKLEFVRLLAENKARLQVTNRWNENIMEVAELKGNKEIIDYLKKQGALTKKQIVDKEAERFEELAKIETFLNQKNPNAIVEIMRKYPEVTFTLDQLKKMAILSASTSNLELLQLILEDKQLNTNTNLNFEQQNMLHIAAQYDNLNFVRLLVNKGVDYKKKDAFDKLPVDYANSKEMKKYLKGLE